MFEISVETQFSAAHRLRGYEGKCAVHHGHNWDVQVFVRGKTLNDLGMLVDFRDLKDVVRGVVQMLDHTELNAVDAFSVTNPTSENIARFLQERLAAELDCAAFSVHRVAVRETAHTEAVYWSGDD